MGFMTIGDLNLALADLFGDKRALLERTLAFRIFGPALDAERAQLADLHLALADKPLAVELAEADLVHDANARAIHYLGKAFAELPSLSDADRALVLEAVEAFAPALDTTQARYEDEAASAQKKRQALEAMRARLEGFAVAPSHTLFTLAAAHVEAGERIDALLSSRAATAADAEAKRTKAVAALRSKAVGTLGRLREAVAHEVETDTSLPRDLESRIFSYCDQLAAARSKASPKTTLTAPTQTQAL